MPSTRLQCLPKSKQRYSTADQSITKQDQDLHFQTYTPTMDWIDDLSEEWPSQPPSDYEDALPNNKSQPHSSIPRPGGSTRRKSILTERSGNQGTTERRSGTERSARHGLARRSLSAESNQSVIQHGTTARKSLSASPPKSRNTPEWKRRLLGGDMAYGEQKDLFSDMGIQSIFKPPPAAPAQPPEKERSRGLSFLKSLDTIPSSPPTWNQDNTQSRRARFSSGSEHNLHAVYESDEESARERSSSRQEQEDESRNCSAMRHQPSFRRNPRISLGASSLASRPSSLGSVRLHPGSRNASQGASFQSEGITGGSDFSPVFISKHNTSDGQVGYAALDLSKSQLKEHLRDLAESHASQQSNDTTRHVESSQVDESSLARLESENLPEDLPVGTPDVADVGEFVSIKRGGYSDQGSFRRRPLSPSPLRRPMSTSTVERSEIRTSAFDQSEMDSLVVPPAAPTPPEVPQTPKHLRGEQSLSPGKRNSASPLKLFGNHDTFTSNKLQRRLSQLEDSIQIQIQPPSNPSSQSPSRRNTQSRLPSVEEKSFQSVAQQELSSRHPSIEGYFGQGELDHTISQKTSSIPILKTKVSSAGAYIASQVGLPLRTSFHRAHNSPSVSGWNRLHLIWLTLFEQSENCQGYQPKALCRQYRLINEVFEATNLFWRPYKISPGCQISACHMFLTENDHRLLLSRIPPRNDGGLWFKLRSRRRPRSGPTMYLVYLSKKPTNAFNQLLGSEKMLDMRASATLPTQTYSHDDTFFDLEIQRQVNVRDKKWKTSCWTSQQNLRLVLRGSKPSRSTWPCQPL